jgi:signal transduction histidine kinase/DNA-binding NarL/FixJ family response regulator
MSLSGHSTSNSYCNSWTVDLSSDIETQTLSVVIRVHPDYIVQLCITTVLIVLTSMVVIRLYKSSSKWSWTRWPISSNTTHSDNNCYTHESDTTATSTARDELQQQLLHEDQVQLRRLLELTDGTDANNDCDCDNETVDDDIVHQSEILITDQVLSSSQQQSHRRRGVGAAAYTRSCRRCSKISMSLQIPPPSTRSSINSTSTSTSPSTFTSARSSSTSARMSDSSFASSMFSSNDCNSSPSSSPRASVAFVGATPGREARIASQNLSINSTTAGASRNLSPRMPGADRSAFVPRIQDQIAPVARLQAVFGAMTETHAALAKGATPDQVFTTMLNSFLKVTGSAFGFISQVIVDEHVGQRPSEPYLRFMSVTNISWDETSQKFYDDNYKKGIEFHNLDSMYGLVVRTRKPVISNDPENDPRRKGKYFTPPGHPKIESFLGLPFFFQGELVGIIGLANRFGGYDKSMIPELEPLIVTSATIVRSVRVDIERHEDAAARKHFWANTAHELRTPLQGIVAVAELAKYNRALYSIDDASPAELRRMLHEEEENLSTVLESGNTLLSIVNNVLDYSRLEAAQMRIVPSAPANMASVIDVTIGVLNPTATSKNVRISQLIDQSSLLDHLIFDSHLIQRVIVNLLSNSVKFSHSEVVIVSTSSVSLQSALEQCPPVGHPILPTLVSADTATRCPFARAYSAMQDEEQSSQGTAADMESESDGKAFTFEAEQVRYLLSLRSDDGAFRTASGKRALLDDETLLQVCVNVEDRGIGFDTSQSPNLFRPFRQSDESNSRRFGGTGIGLATCRHVANLVGGELVFESQMNIGTTFTFRFPVIVKKSQLIDHHTAVTARESQLNSALSVWHECGTSMAVSPCHSSNILRRPCTPVELQSAATVLHAPPLMVSNAVAQRRVILIESHTDVAGALACVLRYHNIGTMIAKDIHEAQLMVQKHLSLSSSRTNPESLISVCFGLSSLMYSGNDQFSVLGTDAEVHQQPHADAKQPSTPRVLGMPNTPVYELNETPLATCSSSLGIDVSLQDQIGRIAWFRQVGVPLVLLKWTVHRPSRLYELCRRQINYTLSIPLRFHDVARLVHRIASPPGASPIALSAVTSPAHATTATKQSSPSLNVLSSPPTPTISPIVPTIIGDFDTDGAPDSTSNTNNLNSPISDASELGDSHHDGWLRRRKERAAKLAHALKDVNPDDVDDPSLLLDSVENRRMSLLARVTCAPPFLSVSNPKFDSDRPCSPIDLMSDTSGIDTPLSPISVSPASKRRYSSSHPLFSRRLAEPADSKQDRIESKQPGVKKQSTAATGTDETKVSAVVDNISVPSTDAAGAVQQPSRPVRVMIVDDNKVNQKVLRRQIIALGTLKNNVLVANDGKIALDLYKCETKAARPIDFILMDLQMPNMDGFECTTHIRAFHKSAKFPFRTPWIVATSASLHGADSVHDRCLKVDMNATLPKPVTLSTLASRVAEARKVGIAFPNPSDVLIKHANKKKNRK